jgi:hypothetical protein
MEAIKLLNLALRFLLELCLLIIMGYWGFKTGNTTFNKLLLGIGSPILFAVVWGAFLAPKSSLRLQEPWLLILEIIIFGLATWALYSSGKASLAYAFVLVYVLNKILLVIWRQS